MCSSYDTYIYGINLSIFRNLFGMDSAGRVYRILFDDFERNICTGSGIIPSGYVSKLLCGIGRIKENEKKISNRLLSTLGTIVLERLLLIL